MSESGKAVFLSYASQDAEAAKRIAEALRAAGVEVWFDQSELRGGDAWDAMIRKRIKECSLFVPVITPATNARAEGYFRLEWKLAVDRSHLMADDAPFLFPIVIGDVTDATARVPDKFREVQWTRLRLDETPQELAARVARLLSGNVGSPLAATSAARSSQATTLQRSRWQWWMIFPILGTIMGLLFAAGPLWKTMKGPPSRPVAPAVPAVSESRQLLARARAMSLDKYDSSIDDFIAAEGLVKRALELDPNDGELWAASSLINFAFNSRGFDRAPARNAAARAHAERALKLAPDSTEALFALGRWQRDNEEPALAEATLLKVLARNPRHLGALHNLGYLYDRLDRLDEAAALYAREAETPAAAPLAGFTEFLMYFRRGRFAEADIAVRKSIAGDPAANSQSGLAMLRLTWKGDAEGAAAAVASGPATIRREHRPIWITALVHLCRRKPDEALRVLDRLPDEYILDNWYTGPKAYFVGLAHAQAGREAAARVAWEAGLATVDQRLQGAPADFQLRLARGELLAWLGREREALAEVRTLEQLAWRDQSWIYTPVRIHAALGRADDALRLIETHLQFAREHRNLGWHLTPALLRVDPRWDKIRSDPRFQKLCEEPGGMTRPDAASKVDDKSVAVLAFANLSDDKANEYFSDGISEELLNVLAKVPGLKVSARTSAFHFKGKDTPIPEIAKQLGVAYVVEGSVRKQGDKVRITAQLIKAVDGFHVWSDTFTRDLRDIFAVQDEIAGLIAKALSLKLGNAAPAVTASVNPEAFRLYLEGRQAWNQRTGEGFAKAEVAFREALELEPNFARALSGLADVGVVRRSGSGQRLASREEIVGQAKRAIALDPTLADPHATLGVLEFMDWNFAAADSYFQRAFALNPSYAWAHLWCGQSLMTQGRVEEALAENQRALEADPLAPRIASNTALLLLLAGRPADALASADRTLSLLAGEPQAQTWKAEALLMLRREAEALKMVREALAIDPKRRDFTYVLASTGTPEERAAAVAAPDPRFVNRTRSLLATGRVDEALAGLESDVRDSVFSFQFVLFHPAFDEVRKDPRFVKMLESLRMTEAHERAQAWRSKNSLQKERAK